MWVISKSERLIESPPLIIWLRHISPSALTSMRWWSRRGCLYQHTDGICEGYDLFGLSWPWQVQGDLPNSRCLLFPCHGAAQTHFLLFRYFPDFAEVLDKSGKILAGVLFTRSEKKYGVLPFCYASRNFVPKAVWYDITVGWSTTFVTSAFFFCTAVALRRAVSFCKDIIEEIYIKERKSGLFFLKKKDKIIFGLIKERCMGIQIKVRWKNGSTQRFALRQVSAIGLCFLFNAFGDIYSFQKKKTPPIFIQLLKKVAKSKRREKCRGWERNMPARLSQLRTEEKTKGKYNQFRDSLLWSSEICLITKTKKPIITSHISFFIIVRSWSLDSTHLNAKLCTWKSLYLL